MPIFIINILKQFILHSMYYYFHTFFKTFSQFSGKLEILWKIDLHCILKYIVILNIFK